MSNLAKHALQELERAGLLNRGSDYDGMIGRAVMKMVEAFSAEGHSGFSANMTLDIFDRVARFKTLTPLTSDPAEWTEVGESLWQSTRMHSCFSADGGKTHYDIDGDRKVVVQSEAPAGGTAGPAASG